MKASHQIVSGFLFIILFVSCKSSEEFEKRKYTEGRYKDFNLENIGMGRDKNDGNETRLMKPDSIDGLSFLASEEGAGDTAKFFGQRLVETMESREVEHLDDITEQCPRLVAMKDSMLAHSVQKDSVNIFADSLPDSIETALASQAMLGVATVGGLATLAAPQLIWFTFLPIMLSPLMLLVSLIAAAVAMGKINSGEIDGRYRKCMRLWAVLLLANLLIAGIVITQQGWF